jgi:hypothetical protein
MDCNRFVPEIGFGCIIGLICGVSSSVDGPEEGDPKKKILARQQKELGGIPTTIFWWI